MILNKDFYIDVNEDKDVMCISIKNDVRISELKECLSINCDISGFATDDGVVKSGTSIFVDKNSNVALAKCADKNIIMINKERKLFIDFNNKGYVFKDDVDTYDSRYLTKEGKHLVYESILKFMRGFKFIYGHLPVDSSVTFMFLFMGILNKDEAKTVYEGNGILLYLNSFRRLDLSKLKLNIADSYTYEVVGTIELSLNKKDKSNFSYSGNVSYKINSEHEHKGYATDALRALIDYVKTLSDEYNKELYIASLVDDEYYQRVAISNGGVLEYDGEVPDGDSLAAINKIKEVKIYKIDGKSV